MREYYTSEVMRLCTLGLKRKGLTINKLDNFSEVTFVIEKLGKDYLTPTMSPFLNDFTPANCFWLLLETEDQVIAMGGGRLDDLGGCPVTEFWDNMLCRQYNRPRGELLKNFHPAADRIIKGRIAYLGDLFVHKEHRWLSRNAEVVTWFAHFAQMYAHQLWDPDLTYSFIPEHNKRRDAQSHYGYERVLQNVMEWIDPPSPRTSGEACAIIERQSLIDHAQQICRLPESFGIRDDHGADVGVIESLQKSHVV